jgi:tRNA-specific 2-thiouridylase
VKKALIAMSGGVDSSVAALLTAERGFDCVGCMMKLFGNEDIGESPQKACCSAEDAQDARSVSNRLGIPFYMFNFADACKSKVIDRFVKAYQNGDTPNPCIDCNRFLKFDTLLRRADELDTEYIVTGHYARIECHNGRYLLKKAIDESKDQSYVLYTITQAQLGRTLFPLGELHKSRISRRNSRLRCGRLIRIPFGLSSTVLRGRLLRDRRSYSMTVMLLSAAGRYSK